MNNVFSLTTNEKGNPSGLYVGRQFRVCFSGVGYEKLPTTIRSCNNTGNKCLISGEAYVLHLKEAGWLDGVTVPSDVLNGPFGISQTGHKGYDYVKMVLIRNNWDEPRQRHMICFLVCTGIPFEVAYLKTLKEQINSNHSIFGRTWKTKKQYEILMRIKARTPDTDVWRWMSEIDKPWPHPGEDI